MRYRTPTGSTLTHLRANPSHTDFFHQSQGTSIAIFNSALPFLENKLPKVTVRYVADANTAMLSARGSNASRYSNTENKNKGLPNQLCAAKGVFQNTPLHEVEVT